MCIMKFTEHLISAIISKQCLQQHKHTKLLRFISRTITDWWFVAVVIEFVHLGSKYVTKNSKTVVV